MKKETLLILILVLTIALVFIGVGTVSSLTSGDEGQSFDILGSIAGGSCTHAGPTVTISPSSQSGAAGTKLSYIVFVKNNDNRFCQPSNFTLAEQVPSGWKHSLISKQMKIWPGGTRNATLTATSLATTPAGTYQLAVRALNLQTGLYTDGIASYILTTPNLDNPPTVSVSVPSTQPDSTQIVTFTAIAADDKSVSSMQIFVDYIMIGSCTVSGPSTFCLKTAGPYMSGSNHTYYATATDTKPQVSQSQTNTFTIS